MFRYLSDLSTKRILLIGDFMLDKYLQGSVSRISPEAPVPIVHIENTDIKLGGAGNVAANLASLQASVRVLGCIGKDAYGDLLLNQLSQLGIDTDFMWQDESRHTTLKTRVVSHNQQLLRYDEEAVVPVNGKYRLFIREKIEEMLCGIDGILISDYGKGAITHAIARLLIEQAEKRGIPITVDPKGRDYGKYAGATVCTPNLKELTEICGVGAFRSEQALLSAATALGQAHRMRYLLVTRSEKGMSLIDVAKESKQDFPAVAREVSDVTGAGDTVIAVFSLCLAAGYPIEICCKLANCAAALVVAKFGAACITLEELSSAAVDALVAETKIKTITEAAQVASLLHKAGKKLVFTNGCFDLVHAGHIAAFRQAKQFGDVLMVGVNSDASIGRLKGENRPIVDQKNRLALLEALECIDYLVLFEEDTPQRLIEAVRPNVLVKGKDWQGKEIVGSRVVEADGGMVRLIDLEEGLSTTAIIGRILDAYGAGER